MIAQFLASSYWANGIPADTVVRSLEHSLCFALLAGDRQVGFARVISDFATIAYLGDVFVLPEYRGRGLAKWLMECVLGHPDLQGLRRWILATRDAHGLYQQLGFTPLKKPETFMERHDPDAYRNA
jgi:GNAT superfamily N-acetyltransferase